MDVLKRFSRFVLARPGMRRINTKIYKAALHGLGVLNYENNDISGENFLLREYLPKKIRNPSPVLFDVGANVGDISKLLAASFPGAKIYAFEPHPTTFARLRDGVSDIGRIHVENIALGKEPGSITLYDRSDISGSAHASIYKEVIADIHGQAATSVEVWIDTLDNRAEKLSIGSIDYLKVDTEGNELAVLQGAKKLLQAGRIRYIHFEFNEMNVVSRTFLRDFRILLPKHELCRLLPRGLLPLGSTALTTEIFGYQNILAIPTEDI